MTSLASSVRRALLVVTASLSLLALAPPIRAAGAADYAVSGGWYYTQTGGGTGRGFNVLDGGFDNRGQVTRFYSEFTRLGGVQVLGFPASNVFRLPDGFIYQATQAALLQWHPEDAPQGDVQLANTFDLLSQTGHDKDLLLQGIPPPIANDGSGGDFNRASAIRLSWLTQPDIKAKYLANPNPSAIPQWSVANSIQLYGLPTSMPQRFGPFVVQRFQRVALQLWLDAVPNQPPPGSVVPILGGDLAKQFAVVPATAQQPQGAASMPLALLTVQAAPALQPAIDLLTQYDKAQGTRYMRNLAEHNVAVIVAPLPDPRALGLFSLSDNTIRISNTAATEDAHAIADLVAHESSHALDFWSGVDINSSQGCYQTELTAFKHQVDVWHWFYPNLKSPTQTRLEDWLNYISQLVILDQKDFVTALRDKYVDQCGTG